MRRMIAAMPAAWIVGAGIGVLLAAGPASAPSTQPVPVAQRRQQIVDAYLSGDWKELREQLSVISRQMHLLTPQQAGDVRYVQAAFADCRPAWWDACRNSRYQAFHVTILEQSFPVAYIAADKPSYQINVTDNRVEMKLCWNPASMDPESSVADKAAGRSELAELAIWQLLGMSRSMVTVPGRTLAEIYNGPDKLRFEYYSDFRAKLASLHHSSPPARRIAVLMALSALVEDDGGGVDVRTRAAIGHMFLAKVLTDPSKWPSVQLPKVMPKDELIKGLVTAMSSNLRQPWTLAEDKALREATLEFAKANDQTVFQTGRAALPNGQAFMLEKTADGQFESDRLAWIKSRLEKALASAP